MSTNLLNVQESDLGSLARRLALVFAAADEELFLVGGSVRDRLMGGQTVDQDFATSALPERTIEIVAPLGLGRPHRIGERFGTIAFRTGDRLIEITTYRSQEHYPAGSRKPDVSFGNSLALDLQRRDFTINAMAIDPLTETLIDPFDGRGDLSHGLLRAVGNPAARFAEDPLRILRAVRFAARLGFAIEPETWRAMHDLAPTVAEIARERIRDEYSRILTSERPDLGLTLLRDGGILASTVPTLLELTRMPDHGPAHPLSLWDHTMFVVRAVPADLTVRWAAVLHDIAKPATRTHEPSGRPRFFHHEEIGADMARRTLRDLRYPNTVVDDVALLVETHMQMHAYTPEWSDGAVRRLLLRLESLLPDALNLARADAAGHTPDGVSGNAFRYDALQARIADLEREPARELVSPLTGDDLMHRYGRPPGPWIRAIKGELRDQVLDGALDPDDVESAWQLADRLIASMS